MKGRAWVAAALLASGCSGVGGSAMELWLHDERYERAVFGQLPAAGVSEAADDGIPEGPRLDGTGVGGSGEAGAETPASAQGLIWGRMMLGNFRPVGR